MKKMQIYIREARTQIRFARRSYSEFEHARDTNETEAVFHNLHHFLIHVAAVDRILDMEKKPKRSAILAGRIDLTGINIKPARKMRNHLEHFDERLDEWISRYDGHAFFDMNITTGSKGFPYDVALRALDGDTLRFLGEEYSLSEIINEISALDDHLEIIERG